MRRFPLIKNAEVFELEKPLLGSYLIPEPGKYSGLNKYSIILDSDNRVWINEGEYFQPSEKNNKKKQRSTDTKDWLNWQK